MNDFLIRKLSTAVRWARQGRMGAAVGEAQDAIEVFTEGPLTSWAPKDRMRAKLLQRVTFGEVGIKNLRTQAKQDGDDLYMMRADGILYGLEMARKYIDEVLED